MANSKSDNSKTTILVADDEPSTLALVAGHLRSKGYQIIEASDGDQAWELACEHLPNLVVLDVMMPGMSGWEVCRKIREAVSLAHTGVVMLTGIGESLNELTSPLYGADAYVDKPFEFGELDRQVESALKRRQSGALGRAVRTRGPEESVPPKARKVAAAKSAAPMATKVREPKASPKTVVAKKPVASKPVSKKAPVKKVAKKAKPAAKKVAVKKALPKKGPAKKTPSKRAPAKKAPKAVRKAAKKAPAKKAPAKKAVAAKAKKRGAAKR